MTRIRKTGDPVALLREMLQRIENLERQNLLLHAAIDATPGLAVKVPEGIHVKPGGSVSVEGDEGLDMKPGSSIKGDTNIKGGVDATGQVKAGTDVVAGQYLKGAGATVTGHVQGGSVGADTNVTAGGNVTAGNRVEGTYVKSTGDMNADGTVRGYAGVMAPIDGSMQSLGPQVGAARSEASAAQSRADSAWNLADSKPTVAYVDAVQTELDNAKNGTTTISPHLSFLSKLTGIGEASGVGGDIRLLGWNMASGRFVYMSLN